MSPKSRDAKPTVALLKAELMRRFNLLKEIGADDLPKKPALKGSMTVLESRLDRISTDGNTTYPLRFDSERRFVRKKIASVLDSIANKKEKETEAKMQEGVHMRITTMIKMRLIHGEFCATNRVNEMLC